MVSQVAQALAAAAAAKRSADAHIIAAAPQLLRQVVDGQALAARRSRLVSAVHRSTQLRRSSRQGRQQGVF